VCVDFAAIDGFLVVNSPVELDVVAVYTANPANGQVSTLDADPIAGRHMPKTMSSGPTSLRRSRHGGLRSNPSRNRSACLRRRDERLLRRRVNERKRVTAALAIDQEIGIEREHGVPVVELGHSHYASIGKGHRAVAVFPM
jgi:hypothetical protein